LFLSSDWPLAGPNPIEQALSGLAEAINHVVSNRQKIRNRQVSGSSPLVGSILSLTTLFHCTLNSF
jgi:hypothetical protein